jgi:enoyl-CoA hydratase/carnithine racemase
MSATAAFARPASPPEPADGQITTDVHATANGGVLLVGINRPNKRNGFTARMFRELAEAYTRLDADPSLRCGVLWAHGAHFTAGLDLPSVAPLMQRGERLAPRGLVDPFELNELDGSGQPFNARRVKPMVVATQGICFTVGIELMLAADVVVAASDCRFGQIEVKRGIMATGGATLRMAERAGVGNAMRLLLTADEFDAAEAYRCHFVQQVVPAGQELAAAVAVAERIAAQAPLAVAAMRRSVLTCVEEGVPAAVAAFRSEQQRLANTADAAEGVRSFVEKRAPRFSGT